MITVEQWNQLIEAAKNLAIDSGDADASTKSQLYCTWNDDYPHLSYWNGTVYLSMSEVPNVVTWIPLDDAMMIARNLINDEGCMMAQEILWAQT
jgi:hypothetical protein